MFTPNTPSIQQAQPGSSLGSLAIGYQTPTCAARTPTSKLNVGLLSSASPGKSPCPASARRVLFLADEKKTTLAEEPMKKSADAAEENYDDKAEDPSSGTKGKDDKTHVTKNKRSSAAGKGPAAGKKTRQ